MADLETKWRNRADKVANLELVLRGSIAVLFLLRAAYVPFSLMERVEGDNTSNGSSNWAWKQAIFTLGGTFALVGTWAALQLRKATDIGRNPSQSRKLCRIWLIVSVFQRVIEAVVVMVVLVVGFAVSKTYSEIVEDYLPFVLYIVTIVTIKFAVDGMFFLVIWRFRNELCSHSHSHMNSLENGIEGRGICEDVDI